MALSFVDTDGTLYIPSAPAKWDVAPSASGTSTTGVVVLVGEADGGPAFSDEDVTKTSAFGPNQRAQVIAKYGSGRLVDAFLMTTAPSKDAQVKGAPQTIYMVKTNHGVLANVTLATAYGKLNAKRAGTDGNLIQVKTSTLVAGALTVTVSRKSDNISESWLIGGKVALTLTNAAGTVTIAPTTRILTSTGAATNLNITLSQYKTLNDLAAFIGTITGWTAVVGAGFGQLSPAAALDAVTTLSVVGGGQIKKDAYDFINALNSSRLVSVDAVTFPTVGLPVASQNVFLSGGTKGGTTDQNVVDALVQAQRIRANFVVTLFSQDATADITAGLTESVSTYTILGVNANLGSHIALCRQFKQRKPRQGFMSVRDTYVNAKTTAMAQASHAVSMCFLEVLVPNQFGTATWFHPWAGAVTAAAMQAAAGYKTIFNKVLNVQGVRAPLNDFMVEDPAALEDAIQNGLLIMAPRDADQAMNFVSDQTTYGFDNNFVLNSIQAVYAADTLSQTVAMKMEIAFKGQNIADVSAGVAMSYLKAVLADCKRQKLIAASDDAATGYKNLKIDIQPPAMLVSGEAKLATGLYFIPIKFLLTQPTQTAVG
jgi:hypothetical protein